jgi:hypothetical protein
MNRCGCPEEDARQSSHSPGLVKDPEPIVFALVIPLTADTRSVAILNKTQLKQKQLSMCRAEYCSYDEMYRNVVIPQLEKDPSRKYCGYHWVTCKQIRDIAANPVPAASESPMPGIVGAFCVIDDGNENYPAHTRVGEARPQSDFWRKHNREAARGNLVSILQQRGILTTDSNPPFKSGRDG